MRHCKVQDGAFVLNFDCGGITGIRFLKKHYQNVCNNLCAVEGKLFLFIFNMEPIHMVKRNT